MVHDVLTPAQRRHNMQSIRRQNTKPEMVLRRELHARGFRFRTNYAALPGKPDIAFTRRKKVVFVNGCFWHSHDCRWGRVTPATNAEFWSQKREATVVRDGRKRQQLIQLGWEVETVWECELRDRDRTVERVVAFLGD
jgi:DNA mismatch endonuclease (patch repair protein)